jgi:stress response protein YsnF
MEIRDVHALLGRTAYDADGDRLGTITGAYLDDATGRPSWITVERGGLFRTTRTFVPLEGVEVVDGGVRVAVAADAVKGAPPVDDDRVLTRADEQELLRHYGLAGPGAAESELDEPSLAERAPEPGPAPDVAPDAMTRSEEQARVGTTTVATSRAVLRTTRVVEERTFSVPLGRDQVQVAYEPLPDPGPEPVSAQFPQGSAALPERAQDRPQERTERDGDDDWVVLYEERLVVRTEWVPVERVRLRTVGVQGEEVVNVDLRRERIDVDVEQGGHLPPGPAGDGRS